MKNAQLLQHGRRFRQTRGQRAITRACSIETLETRRLFAAAGDLDTTFGGGDGWVATDFGEIDSPQQIVVQSDGKIVVAGYTITSNASDFAVARYNTDGSLDDGGVNDTTPLDSFGAGGKAVFDFGTNDAAEALAIQSDGKIVVVGHAIISGASQFAVLRLNTNGTLDSSFDGDGSLLTAFAESATATGVAIDSSGKIVVVGSTDQLVGAGSNYDFAIARYNTDGSLDDGGGSDITPLDSFGTGGKVTTDFFNGDDYAESVVIQPGDGKIVVAGTTDNTGNDFAVARYKTDGSLDASFSSDGKATADFGSNDEAGNSVALQSDGNILVAGYSTQGVSGGDPDIDFALARFNTLDGSLDDSFDTDGKVVTKFGPLRDYGLGVAVQQDGKIVMLGYADISNDFNIALVRYNTNGSLDNGGVSDTTPTDSFGTGGKVITDLGDNKADEALAVALQSDGKILVASRSQRGDDGGYDFVVLRYLAVTPNLPPIANAGGPYVIGPAQGVTLNASGSSDPDSDPLTYTWDINGDATFGDATGVSPTLTWSQLLALGITPGTYNVTVRVSDGVNLAVSSAPTTLTVLPFQVRTDPCDPTKTALFVEGTNGNDLIRFVRKNATSLYLYFGNVLKGTFSPTGRLIAYGLGGNDTIRVEGIVNTPAWFFGGAGNDDLSGSRGSSVLDGGSGNDKLCGDCSPDLLIGGTGIDILSSDGHEDIVIAGYTSHDGNLDALCDIMDEWTRNAPFAVRAGHLQGSPGGLNGATLLKATGANRTVFDDGVIDIVLNQGGRDWFFVNLDGPLLTRDLVLPCFGNDLLSDINL